MNEPSGQHAGQDNQPAIEALLAQALEGAAGDVQAASARYRALLSQLDTDAEPTEGLADVVMLRVQQGDRAAASSNEALGSLDADAIDAMMALGFDAHKAPRELRSRAAAIAASARTVTSGGPVLPSDLLERTMARIEAVDKIPEPIRIRPPARQRFADLVSIAAMLLIVVSVGWPALTSWRSASMRAVCASNMQSMASAMGLYGGDFREHLPAATAGFGGGQTWWNVGKGAEQSNSANLFTLARTGYAQVGDLACPGNEHAPSEHFSATDDDWHSFDEVSYSYRIITRRGTPTLGEGQRFVIAADRSPVVVRAARGQPIMPRENSLNHLGSGQQVLFSDGSVNWTASPVLETGDNIYLPRAIEAVVEAFERTGRIEPIRGTEIPARSGDDFLGP